MPGDDYHGEDLEVIPNQAARSRPAFSSEKERQQFREDYIKAVAPAIERSRLARLRSEHESRSRMVD